jgi:PhnB protein
MENPTREAATGNATGVRPMPEGYTAVTPLIISEDTAKLIQFLEEAFGAEEIARVNNEDGTIGHAEVRIGDAVVMMFDKKEEWANTPAFLRLYVEDADAAFRQAIKAAATPVTEVTHLFFGDRVGRVRDPLGNIWWLQTHIEDVPPAEMEKRMAERKWTDAMAYVQESLTLPKKAP